MMRKAGLLATGFVALAALASCTLPFTSRTTITPIYAATANGVSVFNGTTWTNYTTANGLASNAVNAVAVYGSGANANIVAATAVGVSIYDGSTWTNYGAADGLPSAAVNTVYLGNNYLYAGTSAGLYVLEGSKWVAVAGGAAPGNSTTTINDVYSNGTAYVATSSGLYISDLSGSTGFVAPSASTTTSPPNGPNVSAVFVDQGGDIYAGTSSGLQFLGASSSSWATVGTPSLPSNTVNSIFVDPYFDMYVATSAGLAISFDGGGTWTTYTTADGLGSNQVNQVFVVGNAIYAATAGGVSVSTNNGKTWKNYTTVQGLGSNTVNGIFVSPALYSFGS